MQDVKPSVQHAVEHKSSDGITIEAEASEDHDMPMYVQHTEAMLVEIDRMVFISCCFAIFLKGCINLSVECEFVLLRMMKLRWKTLTWMSRLWI